MNYADLEREIDAAWEARDGISSSTTGRVRDAVIAALAGMDSGELRVAGKVDGQGKVNEWLKKDVLLCFGLCDSVTGGREPRDPALGEPVWYDTVHFEHAG